MPKWTVHHGDCIEVMRTIAESSIDAVVTDPPYGLEFMGKEWDKFRGEAWRSGAGMSLPGIGKRQTEWPSFGGRDSANATCAVCGGRMRGKRRCACPDPQWTVKGKPIGVRNGMRESMRAYMDWCSGWANETFRILKPGAHLLAFGGTRTYHRLACAVEDAGFEIRDQIGWTYGSGFPKSLNLTGEWDGWGTALKPAWEPIVVARKPLIGTVAANVERHGTGAFNIDGCRVPTNESLQGSTVRNDMRGGRFAAGHKPNPGDIKAYEQNSRGRWPANLIHDGSHEVLERFPQTASGKMRPTHTTAGRSVYGNDAEGGFTTMETYGDSGSAARFFYCPKADRADRNDGLVGRVKEKTLIGASGHRTNPMTGKPVVDIPRANHHPTVKPTDLMRYLCRLVTPPGGTVLDPFTGSGSTGRGATLEGFGFVGIEREAEYVEIARLRIAKAAGLFSQETG